MRTGHRLVVGVAAAVTLGLVATTSALAAPPPNDNLAAAELLGPIPPLTATGSMLESTVEAGETAPAGSGSVWYRFEPNRSILLGVCTDVPGVTATVY